MINWDVGFRESSVYHSRISFIARWRVLFLESGNDNKCASSTPAAAAYLNSLTCGNRTKAFSAVLHHPFNVGEVTQLDKTALRRISWLVAPSSSSSSSSVRLSASWFCAFHLFIFKRQLIAHIACCEIWKPPEVVVSIGEIVCRLNLSWSRIVCSLRFLLLALLCLLFVVFQGSLQQLVSCFLSLKP